MKSIKQGELKDLDVIEFHSCGSKTSYGMEWNGISDSNSVGFHCYLRTKHTLTEKKKHCLQISNFFSFVCSFCRKLLMRWTVLTSDVLIFFPAVLWFIIVYASQSKGYKSNLPWHVAMILLNPCLILIDHGHFQACIRYWSKCYKYQHIFLSITTLNFQFFPY